MYKWKPVHTVDLMVDRKRRMVDSSYRVFMPCCAGHGKSLKKGDIWECAIEDEHVRPLCRRRDKTRANAPHVCNEIASAHSCAWTLSGLQEVIGTRKRKIASI